MKSALVDVAVLILFFNNPDRLAQVFKQVKAARPSKLFLYQDGPRKGSNDKEGIQKCRELIEQEIDWNCEIKKWYRDENVGCDPSEYLSQKWAFSYVDKCVVLEDDDVPSVTFFSFCKELLDKYENDTRISMIAGLNHEEITPNIPYDYFFTRNMSIWGWASWKRVIDQWDSQYTFLQNDTVLRQINDYISSTNYRKDFLPMCVRHQKTGVEYYESIFGANLMLTSGLCIVPTKNMIHNIGFTGGAVHYSSPLKQMPKAVRRLFEMGTYDVEFPLVHPQYVIEEVSYKERVYKIMGWNHPLIKLKRKMETLFLKLLSGDFKGILIAFKKFLTRNNI